MFSMMERGEVEAVVIIDCDMEMLAWDEAIPVEAHELAVRRDDRLAVLCNMIDNLTLPVAYMWNKHQSDREAVQTWLHNRGLPSGKIFMRDASEDLEDDPVRWTESAIHVVLEQYDLPHAILMTDGMNLGVQVMCEENGWLHIAI